MKNRLVITIAMLLVCFTGYARQKGNIYDSVKLAEHRLDTLRCTSISLGTNFLYWGSATPNAHFWIPAGNKITLGMVGGLKPWPRWFPWDNDPKIDSKWRHFAVVPGLRFWPKYNYSGLWLGADLLWTHYNVGGVTFPFGLYPEVRENRMQGDFFGIGFNIGYSWWLSKHLRLELEAGLAAGYNTGNRYQCAWCGANLGKTSGPAIVPKLGLSLAYNFFREKTARKQAEPAGSVTDRPVIPAPSDTVKTVVPATPADTIKIIVPVIPGDTLRTNVPAAPADTVQNGAVRDSLLRREIIIQQRAAFVQYLRQMEESARQKQEGQ